MKIIPMLTLWCSIATAATAQSDLCWRDPYPSIPGEWAGSGSVIEAGNRFRGISGAILELWATTYKYDDARQYAIRHTALPAILVETAVSDAQGGFVFKSLRRGQQDQSGHYEIRAHMPGRESSLAYTGFEPGLAPQWMGRGTKVALSHEGKGCSRIYPAGLDDIAASSIARSSLRDQPKLSSQMGLRLHTPGSTFISTAKCETKIPNSR